MKKKTSIREIKLSKKGFSSLVKKLTEQTWDELGKQSEMNRMLQDLVEALSEAEELRKAIIHRIEKDEDDSFLPALEKLDSMIKEKQDLIELLALKTTPYVNEENK